MAAKIKKGDRVLVLAGKDRGSEGEVLAVHPQEDRITVKGINMIRRHQKQTATSEGGIISREAKMHISNVALKDPKEGGATKVGFVFQGEGDDRKKVRVAKKSGEVIDG